MQKAGSAPTLPALLYFQEKDADHIYSVDREDPSRIVYYPTGRPGAGTEGYNSPVTALGSKASLLHWSTYFGHKISKIRCQKIK